MEKEYLDWPWKAMDTIPVDNELNTLLRLNSEFPLAVSHDNLSKYKNGFVNWHKQSSIEISLVTEGRVTVNLLNRQEVVKTGEGFLILPGVLHSIRSDETKFSAKYETMIFEPCLLTGFRGSFFEKNYYKQEIISRNGFFRFDMSNESLRSCVYDFKKILNDNYWGDAYLQNQIQYELQKIWIVLWNEVIKIQATNFNNTDSARLLEMVDFLQKNYQRKFELDELCKYVNLSRSACCRYFKKMMNMSISDYMIEYRVSQALFMLDNTDKSITEIAFQSGFASTSYFIAKFKEKMNVTPREYKKQKSKTTLSDELKSFLYKNGAGLVGFADLSCILETSWKYGISIACPISEDIVRNIVNGPTEDYFKVYHEIEHDLNKIAMKCEEFLLSKGYSAYAQTNQRIKEDSEWRTLVPHKTVATNAGIGWIGKSCLLVTEQYGSAIRLTSILTDAPLACDEPIKESRCKGCRKCVDACPAQALSGVSWRVDVDRDEMLDKEACVEKQIELTRKNTGYEKEFLCGKCFAVCPFTQRYIKNAGAD